VGVGFGDPLRRLEKAIPRGILADGEQDLAHGPLEAGLVYLSPGFLLTALTPHYLR
jgi:hypothetical protein